VIAQEAGSFVTGSKDAPHDGPVTEAILTGRRYHVMFQSHLRRLKLAKQYKIKRLVE